MDKVKAILLILKKQHFWVLTGLAVLLGAVGWFLASGSLAEDKRRFISTIQEKQSTVQQILARAEHPNTLSQQGMEQTIKQLKLSVHDGWEMQYNQQGRVLQWPEIFKKELRDRAIPLRPIEDPEKVPFPSEKEVLYDDLREHFRDRITLLLPKLAEQIGAVWAPQGGAGRGGPGGEGEGGLFGSRPPVRGGDSVPLPGEKEPIVVWNTQNQGELVSRHFDWSHRVDLTPTTHQVLYAQEDYWVLKSLMDIIARTNEDADAAHKAIIREIDYIAIGAQYVGRNGEVLRLASAGPLSPDGEAPLDGAGEYTPPPEYGREGEFGEGGAGSMVEDPASGRYVDKNYQPLTGEQLRSAATSTDPALAYLAVAKRMPVRMRLIMDHRRVNKLLAECGNSDLTVEVRQVRVNRGGGINMTGGGGGGSQYSERGGGERGGVERGRFQPGGSERFGGQLEGGGYNPTVEENPFPYDMPVEIYGIVYLYNPVDDSKLGITPDAALAPGSTGSTSSAGTSTPPSPTADLEGGGSVPSITEPEGAGEATAGEETGNLGADGEGEGANPAGEEAEDTGALESEDAAGS